MARRAPDADCIATGLLTKSLALRSAHPQRKHLPFAALASQRELIVARLEGTRINPCVERRDVFADLRGASYRRSGGQILVENSNFVRSWRGADWQQDGRVHPAARYF